MMFGQKRAISILFLFFILGIFFVYSYVFAQVYNVDGTVKISVCGNFVVEGGEECDNYDFADQNCSTFGFNNGTLSCEPDCSIDFSGCYNTTPPPSGGGGGGGVPIPLPTGVNISGRAYPLSEVTVLKDGQIAAITIAGPDSNFSVSLTGLSAGNYNFAVYTEDSQDRRSSLFTFSIYIASGTTANISGIFISPTIAVDKSQVKRGEDIVIFGQSIPEATITISVSSEYEHFRYINTDNNGAYLLNFDTSVLEEGNHSTKSKSRHSNEVSSYGRSVAFVVGDSNVEIPGQAEDSIADVNGDNRINLVDFSIVAYWYKRSNPPASADLNNDGKVDLVDFSILAYHWTG